MNITITTYMPSTLASGIEGAILLLEQAYPEETREQHLRRILFSGADTVVQTYDRRKAVEAGDQVFEIPAFLRPAERGRNIKATMRHDAGAFARCGHCGRYSDNYGALAKDGWPCDCGHLHGWSGSFKRPTAESKWSDATLNEKPEGGARAPISTNNERTDK